MVSIWKQKMEYALERKGILFIFSTRVFYQIFDLTFIDAIQCYIEFISREVRDSAVKAVDNRVFDSKPVRVHPISHDEMETKVRQHRKYLKQSDLLKRQAAKEREANAKLGEERPEVHIPKVPEDPGTPEKDRLANISMDQDSESSSVSKEFI